MTHILQQSQWTSVQNNEFSSESHLKILGAKSVTKSKFPDWNPTNISWHHTKFSCHGNLALRIFKPLIKEKGD